MRALFKKRIPTLLGIIFILLTIPFITFLIKNQTALKSRASDSQKPLDMRVTNISDRSITITYLTELPFTGSINYGSNKKLGESELEDVDKEKESFVPKKIHSISIKGLMPSKKYYLAIVSGSNTFLNDGALFETTTGPSISSSSAKQQVVKGKIVLPNGNAPSEAIVYLNADNSQLLSSTVTKDGKFSFSLKDLRTSNLSSYFTTNDATVFTITAIGDSLKSTVSTSLSQTDSLPTITLSNNYDFAQEISPLASESAKTLSFPAITPAKKILKPQIINPKQDQSLNSQKPQFRGTSLPNEKVEIIIHSDEQITTQVIADNNGNWTYQPPSNLSPGVHTLTIKSRDSSGILTTITQSFTVFAAEITPTPTATPTAFLSNTPSPTIIPFIPSPTLISTPTPTNNPLPTLVSRGSKGGLPPTGNSPIFLIIGGIVTSIIGSILFFLTRTVL